MVVLRGRVSRRHLKEALHDINDFTIRRWAQAREASETEDPDERQDCVEACTLVMGGPGSLDEIQIDRSVVGPLPMTRASSRLAAAAQLV